MEKEVLNVKIVEDAASNVSWEQIGKSAVSVGIMVGGMLAVTVGTLYAIDWFFDEPKYK